MAGSWGEPALAKRRESAAHVSERAAQLRNAWLPIPARPGAFALVPLFAFVGLIPVEEALTVGGVGTFSRGAAAVFALLYALPRIGRLTIRAMPLAGWAYVEWAVLSTIWSISASAALGELSTLVQLFVIAVLIADVVIKDPSLVRPLLWTYSVSAAFTAALGILSFLAGNRVAGERVAALPGQNAAAFAALLLPAFVFCAFELLRGRRPALSLPLTLVSLGGIILSGTRGAWLSILAVLAFFVFPALELRRKVAAAVLLPVVFGAVLLLPGTGSLIVERAATAGDTGGAGRTDIWSVGLVIFEHSPVIGVGYANFSTAYTPQLVLEAGVGFDHGVYRPAHNIVISTSAELGIVGLVLLGLFLVPLVLRRGWGPEAQVIRAILAAFMVDGLFVDLFGNRKQVWLVIGLAAGLAYLARRAEAADEWAEAVGGGTVAVDARPSLDRQSPRQPGGRTGTTVSPGLLPRGGR
jgi:exopolysaccharide production protein ExoQ